MSKRSKACDIPLKVRQAVYERDERKCFLCGRNGNGDPLDRHHGFFGSYRKNAEKYDLCVYLCHFRCHIFGPESAHQNRETDLKIKRYLQEKIMMEQGWTTKDFIREFGRNYL